MITFKSHDDLKKLDVNNPAYIAIKNLLQQIITSNTTANRKYNFQEDGYIVLIEKDDIDCPLNIFHPPLKLVQVKWEGITLTDHFFHAVKISGNQFAISFIIPNEPWLSPTLRKSLDEHMDNS